MGRSAMGFRRVKNDSGSRCKWPLIRRKGDSIELLIDVHDVDRLGLAADDRVSIDVDESAFALAVAKADADDHHAWRFAQNKGGDIKVAMGYRALGIEVSEAMPASSVELRVDGENKTLILVFQPKESPAFSMELLPLA